MESLTELGSSLQQVVYGITGVLLSLFSLILPWIPLIAWIAFWLLAVNWVKLRGIIHRGGWIGIILIGLVMVLVWGNVAPPSEGHHFIFGLSVSNFVGKTVYVTMLLCIMFLCGSVQLSGCCGALSRLEEADAISDSSH